MDDRKKEKCLKKSNILVYQQPTGQRVERREETCKQRKIRFGLKSAIAAAVVYITYDMGIWGTTDDTQQLYGTACQIFGAPKPKKNDKWDPPSCEAESDLFTKPKYNPYGHCEDPPIKAEDAYLKFKQIWNTAITTVFHGIANFPDNVMNRDDKKNTSDKIKVEPVCVPYSQLSPEEREHVNNKYK